MSILVQKLSIKTRKSPDDNSFEFKTSRQAYTLYTSREQNREVNKHAYN